MKAIDETTTRREKLGSEEIFASIDCVGKIEISRKINRSGKPLSRSGNCEHKLVERVARRSKLISDSSQLIHRHELNSPNKQIIEDDT